MFTNLNNVAAGDTVMYDWYYAAGRVSELSNITSSLESATSDNLKESGNSLVLTDDYTITDFLEAPIMNFHSYCSRLIKKSGTNAPLHLGIREILPKNFTIIEDKIYEGEIFRKFFYGFRKDTLKKYGSFYMTLNDKHESVLSLIKKLSIGNMVQSLFQVMFY